MKHAYNVNHAAELISSGRTVYKPDLYKAFIQTKDFQAWIRAKAAEANERYAANCDFFHDLGWRTK